jgi:hypothetical protein
VRRFVLKTIDGEVECSAETAGLVRWLWRLTVAVNRDYSAPSLRRDRPYGAWYVDPLSTAEFSVCTSVARFWSVARAAEEAGTWDYGHGAENVADLHAGLLSAAGLARLQRAAGMGVRAAAELALDVPVLDPARIRIRR